MCRRRSLLCLSCIPVGLFYYAVVHGLFYFVRMFAVLGILVFWLVRFITWPCTGCSIPLACSWDRFFRFVLACRSRFVVEAVCVVHLLRSFALFEVL